MRYLCRMLEDHDTEYTPISRLGEFGLIEHLTNDLEMVHAHVLKGVGDDAAVYAISEEEVHVVTTDLLVEGVHFDLSYVPLQHLGYKSVVVNISDIYAMNAEPFAITVSIAMSSRFTVEAMEVFYEGIKAACDYYQVDLIGGDTSSSRAGLMISVTAIGRGKKSEIVYRSGAKEHDLIVLSGDLGAAFAGLQVLEREKSVYLHNAEMQPDLSSMEYVVTRQLKPEARGDILRQLRKSGVQPTSMIDVSDGLASELLHLCKQSKTGATIYENKIMIDPVTVNVAESFGVSPLNYALNGGEDYELLFTVPLEAYDKIKEMRGVFIIGHMTEAAAGINCITDGGNFIPIKAHGFNHFTEEDHA
jgi:thiamine-monophosphate kinase